MFIQLHDAFKIKIFHWIILIFSLCVTLYVNISSVCMVLKKWYFIEFWTKSLPAMSNLKYVEIQGVFLSEYRAVNVHIYIIMMSISSLYDHTKPMYSTATNEAVILVTTSWPSCPLSADNNNTASRNRRNCLQLWNSPWLIATCSAVCPVLPDL